jgi:DNA-binding PadR family transcriptional regulator
LAKNYRLAQAVDKDRVYGALKEFTKNPMLWRSSRVGREYCHLTEEGREVIADMMQDILRTVDVLERKAVDQRARELTFEALKGQD